MSNIYRHIIRVSADEVDINGHVNNVHYVKWMQAAAVRHSEISGCTSFTNSQGATWVVRTHRIEYLRPAFADEQITVLTWVSDFRKVRSLRKYKFIRDSDGGVLATGETDWVFVDAKNGRPRTIPDDVKNAFVLVMENQEP
jgi:acyl-CoA thioester hydrolase